MTAYLRQSLFHEHTEENGIPQLAEALEDVGPQIRVLNEVVQNVMVVACGKQNRNKNALIH